MEPFLKGLIVAGLVVVSWNFCFWWIASSHPDALVPSYQTEAR